MLAALVALGAVLVSGCSSGDGDGQFNEPVGLAVDANGNIYAADTWNKRIQVFDPDGKFLRQFCFIKHNGYDRVLARKNVKTGFGHGLAEILRVPFQLVA